MSIVRPSAGESTTDCDDDASAPKRSIDTHCAVYSNSRTVHLKKKNGEYEENEENEISQCTRAV